MIMIAQDRIGYLGSRKDISAWTLEASQEQAREAFFTAKRLDMQRSKEVQRQTLVVHMDKNSIPGMKSRGSAQVSLPASCSRAELESLVDTAVERALVSQGPGWDLPAAKDGKPDAQIKVLLTDPRDSELLSLMNTAQKVVFMAEEASALSAHFAALEFFVSSRKHHFTSSSGVDRTWADILLEVELVCHSGKKNEEAEIVESWSACLKQGNADDSWKEELKQAAARLLKRTAARSKALPLPSNLNVPVLLRGAAIEEFFSHFFYRSGAAQVRMGSSDADIGKPIVEYELGGDLLSFGFDPEQAFSAANKPVDSDGFPLERRVLVQDGRLLALDGPVRHAAALGIEAVGDCASRWLSPGKLDIKELKDTKYLEAIAFSDFFMEASSGDFGGEMRLAILHEGDTHIPYSGGSISGSLAGEAKQLRFSSHCERHDAFYGPDAVLLSKARITGAQ
ncbi:metallopeptidase TldD-related protein [Treponema sp.]